jgi:Serine aminopeptidase, S33
MKEIRLGIALFLACTAACAQEIVTIPSRTGVTQSFFIANAGTRAPEALALLYIGGGGNIRLRTEEGRPKFGEQNFLPRSRREFIRNGILPVIMDAPSDQQGRGGMSDQYRWSKEQTEDARAVLAELKRRFPNLPVFIVSTSRSSLTAASLGRALGDEVAGIVLSSSMFSMNLRNPLASLSAFDFGTIKTPLLIAHHREDACPSTPYAGAERLAGRFPLISVKGGKPPETDPCEPLAPHGFYGKEAETVDAIAAWMLKKPFAKEIE